MGFVEYVSERTIDLLNDAIRHADLVLASVAIAAVLGVGLGVATYRYRRVSSLTIGLTAVIITIPSFALLGLLIPPLGLGTTPAIVALTLYALLPIVRNSVVGLSGVDPALREAGEGMGMSRRRLLLTVELPLAWPVILAGIRVSTQLIMGIAAISAYVGAPGLGTLIFNGLANLGGVNSLNDTIAGTLGVVLLALIFDLGLVLLGRLTVPRGARA